MWGKSCRIHKIRFLMSIDETFDIGVGTRTPADDKDYQAPFRFLRRRP